MSEKTDLIASASRFAIAVAIVYFGYQLAQIGSQVPVITQSVEQVSRHVEPALEEVARVRVEIGEVRQLVPQVLEEVAAVREQMPPIISEVAEIRRQIPPLLAQVEAINQQIDPILQRVDETVAVVDQTQQLIPQIVAATDNVAVALNDTRREVVPLVPKTLEEIRLTRESVDPTLDRVEDLVEDTYVKALDAIGSAESAGKQASEGAVKGFFTGLVKLPFELVGTLASPMVKNIDANVAKQLTEKDIELMVEAGNRAVKSGRLDQERLWENSESGNSGSITIIRRFELQGLECYETRIRISNRRKEIQDKTEEFCRNQENKWVLANEVEGN